MRDMEIQHPDITQAERTGYPFRMFPAKPDRATTVRMFMEENRYDFFLYCMGLSDVIEDYLEKNCQEFQDWQWDNYRDVGW